MSGWFNKYVVSKTDGTPVSPQAKYLVLRLDTDEDAVKAALAYADAIAETNPAFADDIRHECGGTFLPADLIASGYEWICPNCGHLNQDIEAKEESGCKACGLIVSLESPEHALP